MRENRLYGLEGGGPQLNAVSLPLSFFLQKTEYLQRMQQILITGAEGFIGQNLDIVLRRIGEFQLVHSLRSDSTEQLRNKVRDANVILHLAGVNRPKDSSEFISGNVELTAAICDTLERRGSPVPIAISSSIQAESDNDYGRSKKAAEDHVLKYAERTKSPVAIFRLPNVFGKWGRPNYNSAVITFCYNIARGLPITINDRSAPLKLVYIDDVVDSFVDFVMDPNKYHGFANVPTEYTTTVGEVADLIQSFADSREALLTERVGTGLTRALYSTYLSYLPTDAIAYQVKNHCDARGSFVEMLKTKDSGQFSFFTSQPGITRGGHYHHSKTEKFLVIRGKALFRFRHILTDERFSLETSGDSPQIVETIPGWAHDVVNVGNEELICMLWANEVFDRDRPDTFACKVFE
jgi:UDP-2-acetamido-2,6-beta-L-arabino-hexul-4-ose reductase